MIYRFINSASSVNGRRLRAGLAILLFPLLILVSIIVGTALHLIDYGKDVYTTFTHDIPTVFRDFLGVVKNGKVI